uniref:Uncharacterized protein n=1 Tax=viral metagenome TaxID=1070528 RepID=A0A6M3LIT5_9ZZZZ
MADLGLIKGSKAPIDLNRDALRVSWASPLLVTVRFSDGTKEKYICDHVEWLPHHVMLAGAVVCETWHADFVSHVREEVMDVPTNPNSCSNPS